MSGECLEYDKKLDGVGPVDNRPSTNYLNHLVQKIEFKNFTHDM